MHRRHFQFITAVIAVLLLAGACAQAPATDQQTTRAPETKACKVVPPKEPVACTMQWDPVCGCDGKTYGNACTARAAGVPESTPGACEKDTVE